MAIADMESSRSECRDSWLQDSQVRGERVSMFHREGSVWLGIWLWDKQTQREKVSAVRKKVVGPGRRRGTKGAETELQ